MEGTSAKMKCSEFKNDGTPCQIAVKTEGPCHVHRKRKRAKGQPRKLTLARADAIVKLIEEGAIDKDTCKIVGISNKTLQNWVNLGREAESGVYYHFFHRVMRARARRKVTHVGNIRGAAFGPIRREYTEQKKDADGKVIEEKTTVRIEPGDWRASAWLLERWHPMEFERRPYHPAEQNGEEAHAAETAADRALARAAAGEAPRSLVATYRELFAEENITAADVVAGFADEANAPWAAQEAILHSVGAHQRTLVKAAHNVGKTHIAVRISLAFLFSGTDSFVLTTAPTYAQMKDVFWRAWRALTVSGRFGGQVLDMEHRPDQDGHPQWFAIGRTARDPEGFSGFHPGRGLIVFDEGSGVPGHIYEASEGLLSGGEMRILNIGNPLTKVGRFFAASQSGEWNTITISALQHPNVIAGRPVYPRAVSPTWPAERRKAWGPESDIYRVRVGGEFPHEDESTLIPLHWIQAAIGREVEEDSLVVAGIDVARYGESETVGGLVRGRRVEIDFSYFGQSLVRTKNEAARIARFADLVAYDDDGVGGAIGDFLEEDGFENILKFRGGSTTDAAAEKEKRERREATLTRGRRHRRPKETRREKQDEVTHKNLVTEAYWELREAFRETWEMTQAGEEDPRPGYLYPR